MWGSMFQNAVHYPRIFLPRRKSNYGIYSAYVIGVKKPPLKTSESYVCHSRFTHYRIYFWNKLKHNHLVYRLS